MKDKRLIALTCFLADIFLSVWSYQQMKDYDAYKKIVRPLIASPEVQRQIYETLLQGLSMTIAIFLGLHFIIFFIFVNGSKFAAKYVRFYSFMAALSCAIMIFSGSFIAILPLMAYAYCFIFTGKPKNY